MHQLIPRRCSKSRAGGSAAAVIARATVKALRKNVLANAMG